MKDDIRNIINFENLTRVRSSIGVSANLPPKNSIVKLIPIEYLERGVKVLIEGKLFIAFIDEKIPVKEEIIAFVISTKPFSLSLGFSSQLNKDENFLVDQILKKFELPNKDIFRKIISKAVEEGQILVKSKILMLSKLLGYIKVSGLEFSLLINLVWKNNEADKDFIEDLYHNLFNEPFAEVCENLFNCVNDLLFANIPQYLSHQIRDTLIYSNDKLNNQSLLNKIDAIITLIKILNEYNDSTNNRFSKIINNFVTYGTKYVLQKSVLKDYDYFPDFVITKKETELTIIHYSIKRIFNSNKNISYKIQFEHNELPFKLSGIIRDKFLLGQIELDEKLSIDSELNSFQEDLFNNWGFRSDIKLNDKDSQNQIITHLNTEINKLVS